MDTQALKAKIVALLEENSYSIATLEKVIDLLHNSEHTYEEPPKEPPIAREPELLEYGIKGMDDSEESGVFTAFVESSLAEALVGKTKPIEALKNRYRWLLEED